MGSDPTVYLYLAGPAIIPVMVTLARDCMTVKLARVQLKRYRQCKPQRKRISVTLVLSQQERSWP